MSTSSVTEDARNRVRAIRQAARQAVADHRQADLDALRAINAELLAALRLCRSAINEEIIAAGDLDHPTIRAHAKAAAQADRAIARADERAR